MHTCCLILPSITDKKKLEKHLCKNNACSQRGVTWQTDVIGLRKCDPGLPSHLFSTEAVTIITVWEFSNTTCVCVCVCVCIYIYIYIHIYTHTHIYTRICHF
jgi:hypothetical protein